MSEQRMRCLNTMSEQTQCDVQLVTPDNLSSFLLPEHPLHPAYGYLSEVHKSDYLRTYFMHHYGGGYSDIKIQTGSWRSLFDSFLCSDAYILGYTEAKAGDIAYQPVSHAWKELVGNGAYICKPYTPLTTEWYSEMMHLLDEKYEELRAHPATHARDHTQLNTGYPLGWSELLGSIFHRVCYKYRDHIAHGLPAPLFYNYL